MFASLSWGLERNLKKANKSGGCLGRLGRSELEGAGHGENEQAGAGQQDQGLDKHKQSQHKTSVSLSQPDGCRTNLICSMARSILRLGISHHARRSSTKIRV